MSANSQLRVSLFCGGRGSSTITRELLRWPNVQLNLLVNAYDDGLSTGELREFIPGMLGPSDFRKNLANVLDLYSKQQHALREVLEHRLSLDLSPRDIGRLEAYVEDPRASVGGIPELHRILGEIDEPLRLRLLSYLRTFFHYRRESGRDFRFADCSLGNLIFAGTYLEESHNFNAATSALANLFGSDARLINVSNGENRVLVALKEDGEILSREVEIVGPQSDKPIYSVYFLPEPLSYEHKATLSSLCFEEKRECLASMEILAEVSAEAREALLSSDAIIYGPGTQFSSLMPSYRVKGLREAIRDSRARAKVVVMNLEPDHDIRGLHVGEILDKLLSFLGDPGNEDGYVTHIFYNRNSAFRREPLLLPDRSATRAGRYKGALIVKDDFENPARPSVHSGFVVVRNVFEVLDRETVAARPDTLDIYVDLLSRSVGLESVVQEFIELPWAERFSKVRLLVNHLNLPSFQLPGYLEVRRVDCNGFFTEGESLSEWLNRGESEYLATLTGDGEYRLRDILLGVRALQSGSFGVVQGSRTQSRIQFATSLRSAYGDGGALFWLSWTGAFLLTMLFALRFKLVLSDTLTGFRLYKRSKVQEVLRRELKRIVPRSSLGVTKLLLRNHVEIAEIPVNYRTFRGFTKISWRVRHALENLTSLIGWA